MKSRLLSILIAISVFASFTLPNQLVEAEAAGTTTQSVISSQHLW
jgi:hypothetical protein